MASRPGVCDIFKYESIMRYYTYNTVSPLYDSSTTTTVFNHYYYCCPLPPKHFLPSPQLYSVEFNENANNKQSQSATMSSSKALASPPTKIAPANATNKGDHVQKELLSKQGESTVAAAAQGGSAATVSQKRHAVEPPGEMVAKKRGGGVNVDISSSDGGKGSGASSQQLNKSNSAKKGSSETPKLDRLTRLGLVMSRVEDLFFCEGKV